MVHFIIPCRLSLVVVVHFVIHWRHGLLRKVVSLLIPDDGSVSWWWYSLLFPDDSVMWWLYTLFWLPCPLFCLLSVVVVLVCYCFVFD